jgi:transposase-like protein
MDGIGRCVCSVCNREFSTKEIYECGGTCPDCNKQVLQAIIEGTWESDETEEWELED